MICLKEQGHQAEGCRSLAKSYLECRMERCSCQALHAARVSHKACIAF